ESAPIPNRPARGRGRKEDPLAGGAWGRSLKYMAKFARYLKLLALAATVNGGGGGRLGWGLSTPRFPGIFAARKLRNQAGQVAFRLFFAAEPLENLGGVEEELVAPAILGEAFFHDGEPGKGRSRGSFAPIEEA